MDVSKVFNLSLYLKGIEMNKTLFVRHSGRTLDLSAITDLFTTVGDVVSAKLEVIPESAKATKMGVFEMSTEQQASDCADRFNGHVFEGSTMSVKFLRGKCDGRGKMQKHEPLPLQRTRSPLSKLRRTRKSGYEPQMQRSRARGSKETGI